MNICLALAVILASVQTSYQHGYLMDPPARSSAWLVDEDYYECCREYLHNQMFCGGKNHQWRVNDGKCSICGEAWDKPNKLWEKGGANYLGKVLRQYKTGSVMDVHVEISANHLGHFEFRVCRVDGWEGDATQECLDQNVLYLANSTEENYKLNEADHTVNLQIQLPDNFTCEHCVLYVDFEIFSNSLRETLIHLYNLFVLIVNGNMFVVMTGVFTKMEMSSCPSALAVVRCKSISLAVLTLRLGTCLR